MGQSVVCMYSMWNLCWMEWAINETNTVLQLTTTNILSKWSVCAEQSDWWVGSIKVLCPCVHCTQVHSFTCSWTNSAGVEQTGFLSHCCSVSVLATLRNMYTCMYTFPMKSSHATFLIKITCLFWWKYLESSSLVAVVKPVQVCGSAIALQLHASNRCENQFVWTGS